MRDPMPDQRRGLALATLAAALWGLAPVATKAALAGFSPEIISVLRLAAAASLFRVLGGSQTRWWPRDGWSALAGVALGADFVLYNYGLRYTEAGLSGLVINVELASTILLAMWWLGERLTLRRALGAVITLVGAIDVGSDGLQFADVVARQRMVGNALVMLAGISWSVFAVAQRRAPRVRNLFRLLTPIFSVAAVTTLPGLVLPGAWSITAGLTPSLMLATLVAACTVGVYAAYARAQEVLPVSVLAIVLTSIPIFAVAFAWLLLGEAVTTSVVRGGIIIIAGILLISTERPATSAVERAP
jgi:drug/metabolite transporter (DMT)-like permease